MPNIINLSSSVVQSTSQTVPSEILIDTGSSLLDALLSKKKLTTTSKNILQLLDPIGKIFNMSSDARRETDEVIGVEIENEFKDAIVFPEVAGWRWAEDHSLRYYGFEYVSEPFDAKKTEEYLSTLLDPLTKVKVSPTNSIRTSIHVHNDCTQLSFIQILTYACTYWILEEYLTPFCGMQRKGNLFCLRLSDSSFIHSCLTNVFKTYTVRTNSLFSSDYRYAALNFASIKKFGTLEFRLMGGTLDKELIKIWIDTILAIRRFSLKFKNPLELADFFLNKTTADKFPYEVLGDLAKQYSLYWDAATRVSVIRDGFELIEPVLALHDSFDFSKELEETKKIKEVKHSWEAGMIAPIQFTNNSEDPIETGYSSYDSSELVDEQEEDV